MCDQSRNACHCVRCTCTRLIGGFAPALGLRGFLNQKDLQRKKSRAFKNEERLFSVSSKTSPVVSQTAHCFAAFSLGSQPLRVFVAQDS